MTQQLLYNAGMHSASEEQARSRVAQIVNSNYGKLSALQGTPKNPSHRRILKRSSIFATEDKIPLAPRGTGDKSLFQLSLAVQSQRVHCVPR